MPTKARKTPATGKKPPAPSLRPPAVGDALAVAAMARTAADNVQPPSALRKNPPPNKHLPTQQLRSLVELAMLNEMTHDQTAKLVGVDANTLRAHYADELSFGKLRMISRVSANLYRIAAQQQDMKAALTASIFLLKSKGGYNDRAASEQTATIESAGPIRFTLRLGERSASE